MPDGFLPWLQIASLPLTTAYPADTLELVCYEKATPTAESAECWLTAGCREIDKWCTASSIVPYGPAYTFLFGSLHEQMENLYARSKHSASV